MAYYQYLIFDGVKLPLPKSYDVQLSSIEADSSGETEAGTTQRDVIRARRCRNSGLIFCYSCMAEKAVCIFKTKQDCSSVF